MRKILYMICMELIGEYVEVDILNESEQNLILLIIYVLALLFLLIHEICNYHTNSECHDFIVFQFI